MKLIKCNVLLIKNYIDQFEYASQFHNGMHLVISIILFLIRLLDLGKTGTTLFSFVLIFFFLIIGKNELIALMRVYVVLLLKNSNGVNKTTYGPDFSVFFSLFRLLFFLRKKENCIMLKIDFRFILILALIETRKMAFHAQIELRNGLHFKRHSYKKIIPP